MDITLKEEVGLANMVDRMLVLKTMAVRSVCRSLGILPPPVTEAERLAALRATARPPQACGPDMPTAPARGLLIEVVPQTMVRTEDGYDLRHTGFRGRNAARARDVWDAMADQARRAGGFDPFSRRQKDTARLYAMLVERHSSVGLKGRSVEVVSGRSGRGHDGIEGWIIDEGNRIGDLRAAIGTGLALEVRRSRKPGRTAIRLIDLVDAVCLEGLSIDAVLTRFGWARKGDTRAEAQSALADALDRMSAVPRIGA